MRRRDCLLVACVLFLSGKVLQHKIERVAQSLFERHPVVGIRRVVLRRDCGNADADATSCMRVATRVSYDVLLLAEYGDGTYECRAWLGQALESEQEAMRLGLGKVTFQALSSSSTSMSSPLTASSQLTVFVDPVTKSCHWTLPRPKVAVVALYKGLQEYGAAVAAGVVLEVVYALCMRHMWM